MTMLEHAVVDKEALDEEAARAELVLKLDYLPLAIAQAAAYINVNSILVSDYLDLL